MKLTEKTMMYNFNIGFHFVGIALLLMLLSMSDWHKTVRTVSNKAYLMMFVESFASIVLDILSILSTNFNRFLPNWVTPLICRLYLISLVVVAMSILRYVTIQSHPEGIKFKYFFHITEGIMVLFCLGVLFSPIYSYYDLASVYILGLSTEICAVGAVSFMLVAIAETFIFWNLIPDRKRNAILFTACGTLIIAIIQGLYHGLELTSLYLGMSMVYVFFSLENPRDYLDKDSGAFNKMAFEVTMKEKFRDNKKFSVIVIRFYELRYLRNLFGTEKYNSLRKKIISYLTHFEASTAYILGEHETIVMFENRDSFETARKEIGERFRVPWNIEGISLEIKKSMLIIPEVNIPDTIKDCRQMFDYFRDKLMRGPVGNTIYVGITEMSEKRKNDKVNELLKEALKEDRVASSYQLIYDKSSGKPVAVETLLRVLDNGTNGNYLDNNDIFHMTEHDGLINEIAEKHFESVCQMIREVHPDKYGIRRVTVNLSAFQCMQKDMPNSFIYIMERYGIPATYFCFEISSDALQAGGVVIRQNIARLTSAGCSVLLDRFGEQNMDIRIFIDLPISGVKIDSRVVFSLYANNYMKNAVELIGKIAGELSKKLIIYGIEDDNIYRMVSDFDSQMVQGNYFSGLMSEREFKKYLENKEA
ncbi:EAL domain-containing protein [Lachnospiraceae bacterium C1.1]|nr:EAL domain-containing protein [Lachnospiraceae bacterium C1.1]